MSRIGSDEGGLHEIETLEEARCRYRCDRVRRRAVRVLRGGAQSEGSSPLMNGVTDQQEVVYCLYFGITDKDTGTQKLTMDEAKDLVIPLFIEAGSGYTVYEAEGRFATEDGTVVQNDALVLDSANGDEQAVLGLIEKAKQALNIESVYCESREVGHRMHGVVMVGVE